MRLHNSLEGYGVVTIFIHWLVAVTIFGLFFLGIWMVDLDYYSEWYKTGPNLHRSIGVVVAFITILRLIYKLSQKAPRSLGNSRPYERVLARGVQIYFYAAISAMFVSGYFITTASGQSVDVFNWFSLPSIFESSKNIEDIAGEVHEYLAWSIMFAAGLHVIGALKHHFIYRDKTLLRMINVNFRSNSE